MKTLHKTLLLLTTIVALPLYAATPQLSNVIIFGDSLSDIGNFPETPAPFTTSIKPAGWKNLSPMFYVPVSNPVNRRGYRVNLEKLFPGVATHAYYWPSLQNDHLAYQPRMQGQLTRDERSLSWSEFFISDAHQDGLLPTQTIIPSEVLEEHNLHTNLQQSVNYAWASATSFNSCTYFVNYGIVGNLVCPNNKITADVLQARKNYIYFPDNYNYQYLIVPGVGKQVSLFFNDVNRSLVKVGPNTGYIIYIGGNDLLDDYFRLFSLQPSKIANALGNLTYWMSKDVYNSAYRLIHNPKVNARHIYIVTLFDPAYIPYFQNLNWALKDIASGADAYYNAMLKWDVWWLNSSTHHVHLIPGATWFANMHHRTGNYANIVSAADVSKSCEYQSVKDHKDGYFGIVTSHNNCKGFIYWNALHPTTQTQDIFGFKMEQAIIKDLRGDNTNTDSAATQLLSAKQQQPTFRQFIQQHCTDKLGKTACTQLDKLLHKD